MILLGIDLGSSSVKASVIDGDSGNCLASDYFPKEEMRIKDVYGVWVKGEMR